MERDEAEREPERIERNQQRPNRCKYERRTRKHPGKPLIFAAQTPPGGGMGVNFRGKQKRIGVHDNPAIFPFMEFWKMGEETPQFKRVHCTRSAKGY